MIEDLFRALRESGADAGPEELADIFWLATRVGGTGNPDVQRWPEAPEESEPLDPPGPGSPGREEADPAPTEEFYGAADVTDTPGPSRDGIELVRVRRAASLRDPLALMRALRPLGRSRGRREPDHASTDLELDEELTVRRTVEQRLPLPVLRPRKARWLDLALVVDAHHSMLLWHDLVAELRRVFVQTGIFRDVRVWHLHGTDADGPLSVSRTPDGEPRSVQEVSDPSGQRLVLIVTDTVASGWAGADTAGMLRQWSTHGPVALLNVLPRRLWDRGAVRPRALLVRAVGPAAPNKSWRQSPAARSRRRRRPEPEGIAIPVVEATAGSVSVLAKVVAGDGQWKRVQSLSVPRTPHATPAPTAVVAQAPGVEGVDDILRRFRAGASPVAQELAGYLSAVPLSLPVMNLVRQVMLPHSEHGHLAEVALGGLLSPWTDADPTDPDSVPFDFRPGVRAALLGGQRRDAITSVQEVVRREMGAGVSERGAVSGGDFLAGRTVEGEGGRWGVAGEAAPFATRTRVVPGGSGEAPGPDWRRVAEFAEPVPDDYDEREVDERLDEVIARAVAGQGSFTVLVGQAGAGKTTALARALGELPTDWTVWIPRDPDEVVPTLSNLPPRTVVLLHELHLSQGRDMLYVPFLFLPFRSGPFLILDEITEDGIATVPEVAGSNLVHVPPLSSDSAVARRIQHAPPVARAMLRAAMDIQRLGHVPAMSFDLLMAATEVYLSKVGRHNVTRRQMSGAFKYACRPSAGEPPLMLDGVSRSGTYQVVDAVLRADEHENPFVDPPTGLWPVLARHANHASLPSLARSAQERGLSDVARLFDNTHAFYDVSPKSNSAIRGLIEDIGRRLVQVRSSKGSLVTSGIRLSEDGLVVTALPRHSRVVPEETLRVRPYRSSFVAAALLVAAAPSTALFYLLLNPRAELRAVTRLPVTSMPATGQEALVVGFDSEGGTNLTVLRCRVTRPTTDHFQLAPVISAPWPTIGSAVIDLHGAVIGAVTIADEASTRLIAAQIVPPAIPPVRTSHQSPPPGLIDPIRSRAVVIGSSLYEELPELPGTAEAVTSLASALGRRREDGILDQEHVQALWNRSLPDDFASRLSRAAHEAEHTFLLAYAGHVVETPDDAFMAFRNTDVARLYDTALSVRRLRSLILDSPAQHKVLILDGDTHNLRRLWSWFAPDLRPQDTWALLLPKPGQRPHAMTQALTRTLTTGISGGPEFLSLRDIAEHHSRVMSLASHVRADADALLFRNTAFAEVREGTVKWFNAEKGYGFIALHGGPDVFVHYSAIVPPGARTLEAGQRVRLTVNQGDKGPQAVNVHVY